MDADGPEHQDENRQHSKQSWVRTLGPDEDLVVPNPAQPPASRAVTQKVDVDALVSGRRLCCL